MRHPRSVTEQQPVRNQLESQATASSDNRKVRRIYLALAGASLCACLFLDLIYFPMGTIFPDEKRFLTSATRMVETGNFAVGSNRAWEMPGTATFFAAFVWLFSSGDAAVLPIRVAQAFLVLFQAILVGNAAQRIFNDRIISLVAFTMMAFYPFLLYFQGLLLSETLFNTFFIAAVCFLYWWRDRGLRIDGALLLTCICFALATYTKATLTILPPFLVAAVTLRARDWRLTVRAFLVSALIYIAALAPWWVRNYYLLHTFVPFTTSAAENLYLGNNPRNPSGGIDWTTNTDPAVVSHLSAIPDEIERQRAFSAEAMRYIIEDPRAFIQRMFLKFLRLWNVVPNAGEFQGNFYRFVSVASFGPVLVFSIAAVVIWRRRFPAFVPILMVIVYFTILHMVTIASLRYRLPVEPFLIILSAAPIGAVLQLAAGRARLRAPGC